MTRTVKVEDHVSSGHLVVNRVRYDEVMKVKVKTDVFYERWMLVVVYLAWREVVEGKVESDCRMNVHSFEVACDREWAAIGSNVGYCHFLSELDVEEGPSNSYDAIQALFCAMLRHLRGARRTCHKFGEVASLAWRAYLILCTLGVEHCHEHIPVTIAPCFVGPQDVTQTGWRRLKENVSDELDKQLYIDAHLLEDMP